MLAAVSARLARAAPCVMLPASAMWRNRSRSTSSNRISSLLQYRSHTSSLWNTPSRLLKIAFARNGCRAIGTMMAGVRTIPSGEPASRGLLAMVLGAMATGIALGVAGFGARQCLAGATVAFAMTGWASNALTEVTTGLAFFALAALGHVAPPGVIFTGFASSAFWLVLGGMVVAQAMTLSLIHISEPTRLGMISYAVFCLKKKK